ncbi:MAG: ATP-dependent helicase [Catenisphaera adipataccumulans]|jgi:DNA helicase-2/ATP-dependent DNA helicase PcrA|uniref:ATP-dependent helicase n=1 Tax=Catenisphaera adipataccumulans TaxID=700500 RepID=UPI003D925BB6
MEETLNAAQTQAVMTTEGYVRVIAGAGSGKTRALSHRFAYLVNDLGILPGRILCVTFTNKAANEMRRRIHQLTGDNDTGYVSTFHGFCVSVLQEDAHAVSYPKQFMVLDNGDIDQMLGIIYEERGLTLQDMTFAQARDRIEIEKIFNRPQYYIDMINMDLETLHQKYLAAEEPMDIIFYGYLYQEKKCFGLDYNDLIKFTLYIFEQNDAIRLKWQERLEYIMIDEFQDIDQLQYDLMRVLAGYHKNLFVVGDPDQTIYTWRGANVKFLLDFDKDFPGTKTILMTQNYRSTPQILDVCNDLIRHNRTRIEKNLESMVGPGAPVLAHHAASEEKQAQWIVSQIRRRLEHGMHYRDIAILYRAHYVTRSLEEVLIKEKIPYMIYSGMPFFERREIKDALSYLRAAVYLDDLSIARILNVPKRNIGKTRMETLRTYADTHSISLYEALKQLADTDSFRRTKAHEFIKLMDAFHAEYDRRPVSEVLADLMNRSGYERMLRTEGSQDRLDNLAELKQSVFEYETTIGEETSAEHYLRHAALFSNSDLDDRQDRIKLMTVHTAKGLEFPVVFLCSLNEGIFPSKKTRTLQAMEEERRLAFVAMTRAQQYLLLSEAEGKNLDHSFRYPSRFLLEIDPQLMEYTRRPSEKLLKEANAYIGRQEQRLLEDAQRVIYAKGTRIVHPVFGEGTILETDEDTKAYLIQFDTMATPRKITFRAKLKTLQTK